MKMIQLSQNSITNVIAKANIATFIFTTSNTTTLWGY